MNVYHVDAFTDCLFKGNSAGICILDKDDIKDELKKQIAAELKHSETAFVWLKNENETILRWFTPKKEVDLCGHATLAAAHILWEKNYFNKNEMINFITKSGNISALLIDDMIEMDFPQLFVNECVENELLNKAFGIKPIYTGKNNKRYLIEIEDANQLRQLDPDFELLKKVDLGAFMITCKSDKSEYDFLSRFFAPYVGILEDPVTGSAHCYLAPYWSNKLNKKKLIGFQESSRTGLLKCELREKGRLKLSGKAITFYEGIMNEKNI